MYVIDLAGPQGNAFALMGILKRELKGEGRSQDEIKVILDDMKSSDYNHLLSIFKKHLVDRYTLLNDFDDM